MKQKLLYTAWIVLYVICAALGHIPDPEGAQATAMTVMSLLFFIPGAILLADAVKQQNPKQLKLLRIICVTSLSLTLMALVANIAVVNASEAVGNALYTVLNWVSAPMLCSQHWVLSLFLWASLLFASIFIKKR